MKKILEHLSILIFSKKSSFFALWIFLTTISLCILIFVKPINIETQLSGLENSEAAQVMKIIGNEFNTKIWKASALVVEGKRADSLKIDLLKTFPQILRIDEIQSQREHKNQLFYLEYKPEYSFKEIQNSTKTIRDYLLPWSKKHNLKVYMTGNTSFHYDIEEASTNDSTRGEIIALVFSFFILIFNFGALISAFFPIIIGITTIIFSTAIVRISGMETDAISQVLNSLIGLALAIDYSLFIVSRFREEIKSGKNSRDALIISMRNSGKTIFISALIMLCSISVLFIPDVSSCRVVVKSLILALSMSLFNTMFFLPVLLLYGKNMMDKPKFISELINSGDNYVLWSKFSNHIVKYPKTYFISSISILFLLSLPVATIKLWEPSQALVPEKAESRIAYNILEKDGWGGELIPINLVVKAKNNDVYSSNYISFLYDFSNEMKKVPGVNSVQSIASFNDKLKKDDYITYYSSTYSLNFLQPSIPLIDHANSLSLVNIYAKDVMDADQAQNIIKQARKYAKQHNEYQILVGGLAARSKDFTIELYRYIPQMLIIIFSSIYLLLFLHMKSVILPIKAGIMNFLPILSSYGILILVFQYGYFSKIFHTPVNGAITTMIPVTLFCVIFGLSMDYEVLILSRITETFEETNDVKLSITEGIAKSGSVITGAALILLGVFVPGIFSASPVVKELCIGISAAIFIDATIVRLFLVPSFMMLMGKWNWYNPFQKS